MFRRSTARLFMAVAVLLSCSYGQDAVDQPQTSIRQLIVGIQQAALDGSPVDRFFSPSLRVSEKDKIDALQKRGFLTFQIVDYSLKDLRLQDAQHASIPVTVKWSTRGEEASTTTTLKFVKDQGVWYFAHADFWEVSVWWLFFPMIALAVAYGCCAVLMYRHADRQQWLNPRKKTIWQSLSIVPFAPFFYSARRPWTTA